MKGMTTEQAAAMYQSFQNAGMLDGHAAQAVDAVIDAERQAEHARRRAERESTADNMGWQAAAETHIRTLQERVNHLEEIVAWQGKALAELTAIHKAEDDGWECYTDPARWQREQAAARARAFEAAVKAEDARWREAMRAERLDTQIMAGYRGADAQGPRLIKEIMAK
jgi:hypothetical protein